MISDFSYSFVVIVRSIPYAEACSIFFRDVDCSGGLSANVNTYNSQFHVKRTSFPFASLPLLL